MAIAPTTSDSSLPEDGLDRFAYVASHDMAEPLRMVSGYLDLIRESYADQLDADFEEFIQLAVDGVERMHAYLVSLRTYSRIGRLENDPEPVNLRDLVDEAVCRLRPEIGATGAQVTVGTLATVTVDRGQMTLVFEGLLERGVRHAGTSELRNVGRKRRHDMVPGRLDSDGCLEREHARAQPLLQAQGDHARVLTVDEGGDERPKGSRRLRQRRRPRARSGTASCSSMT